MRDRGLFGPDSMMWRINRERVVLLGGAAAAVLQAAHPQVALGVSRHSRFRGDTLGRLRRTLDAVYAVAFGTSSEVEAVRQRVAHAHRAVQGNSPARYSAFDPDAQRWVLATLVMTSANLYQRFVAPLSVEDLDQFVIENARFGAVFGLVPDSLPTRWSDFQAEWDATLASPGLGSIPACAEVVAAIVTPDSPPALRVFAPLLRALVVEYVPAPLQTRLALRPGKLRGFLWAFLDRALPPLVRIAPPRLRYARQYRAAL